jgi:NAD(P)-dependent dehydrogenase (short-subunit alcohol dehydrogenase family)
MVLAPCSLLPFAISLLNPGHRLSVSKLKLLYAAGLRVCRELLSTGFKVRAAARDVDQAKGNTDIAVQFGLIAPDQLSRLTWVEMDLEDPDSIGPAIGGASKVRAAGGEMWPDCNLMLIIVF